MRKSLVASLAVFAAFLGPALWAEAEFQAIRLGEKAAVFQIGRESETNVVVLASRRGLVVIDTGVLPSRAEALRSAIAKEFNRTDFAYVINTHPHFDHVDGNRAFSGVPIVAHQNAVRQMRQWYGSPAVIDAFLRTRSEWKTELEAQLKKAAAGSPDEARTREQMAENDALMDDFRNGRFSLTLPGLIFNDRLTLRLDDLTLNLIYFGRAHTESDILVHVPELRLLLVGDLFFKTWLPSFQGPPSDVTRWFQVLESLPAAEGAVETVVDGHSKPMTGDTFRAQVAYLKDVWDGVAAARREEATLAATKARFPFEKKYPGLAGLTRVWEGQDLHLENIEAAWRLQSESTARALEALIAARGLEAALAEYRKTIAGNERYVHRENETNALGYRYLQSGRIPEAIAVFEVNTEAFPNSWNVWDSLAEAYMNRRDWEKAEIFYAKSIELNPANQNGKDNLSSVRGYKMDAAGETKESPRHQLGARTGLRGPYLGQTRPGSKPDVFAPGIISTSGNFEFSITFSPDGREVYFTRRKDGGLNALMVSRLEKDGWTAPQEAAFAQGFPSNEPHVTPDGKKLYFGSRRPRPGEERADYAIWVVERTDEGAWSEPRLHNSDMYVSVARSGNLYATDVTNLAGGGAIVYPWSDGKFWPPQRLGGGVNSPRGADHSFIAPDESYILFDSYFRPGGQGGEGDLYVCFRMPDGTWSQAFNLGDTINTPATNFCPSVSPDGRFIFFSTCRDIYWVRANVLDDLKAKALGSR